MSSSIIHLAALSRHLGNWREAGSADIAWRSLAEALKLLVMDGRLPLNARLPGERRLAEALGVSRITVSAALDRLRADGFVVSRVGAGSYTALPFDRTGRLDGLFHVDETRGVINMATAVMPATEHVHAAYARALEALPTHLPGHGYEPVGVTGLRCIVARRYADMGLPTHPDQIVVTAGAQNGLALLLRAYGRPGDAVVIDHPTYPHAIEAILRAGMRPLPVALTRSGWDLDGLVSTIDRVRPRLVYLIGAHQNPTGLVMGAAEEAAVARAAAGADALLVMDDALREIWFDRPPPAPVDLGPHVVRLGSVSKTWWGGLRIGWMRASADVVEAVARCRASLDLGTPVIEQLAAAVLLGGDDAPVADRRRQLAARAAALRNRLAQTLPDWETSLPPGGLSLWTALPRPVSLALAVEAKRHGVLIVAGPRFGVDGAFQRFVRLPFCLSEGELDRAVTALAAAWACIGDRDRRPGRARALEPAVF